MVRFHNEKTLYKHRRIRHRQVATARTPFASPDHVRTDLILKPPVRQCTSETSSPQRMLHLGYLL
jgi:hypothetical protein